VHDRGLLAAHPQFLPNPAIHPEYGTAAVAPVQKVRTDLTPFSPYCKSGSKIELRARLARTAIEKAIRA
jgi:hypothetical protein